MFYSVDRFEGDLAVLQDDNKKSVVIKKAQLPKDAKVGMVFSLREDGQYYFEQEETKARKDNILSLQNELFQ